MDHILGDTGRGDEIPAIELPPTIEIARLVLSEDLRVIGMSPLVESQAIGRADQCLGLPLQEAFPAIDDARLAAIAKKMVLESHTTALEWSINPPFWSEIMSGESLQTGDRQYCVISKIILSGVGKCFLVSIFTGFELAAGFERLDLRGVLDRKRIMQSEKLAAIGQLAAPSTELKLFRLKLNP